MIDVLPASQPCGATPIPGIPKVLLIILYYTSLPPPALLFSLGLTNEPIPANPFLLHSPQALSGCPLPVPTLAALEVFLAGMSSRSLSSSSSTLSSEEFNNIGCLIFFLEAMTPPIGIIGVFVAIGAFGTEGRVWRLDVSTVAGGGTAFSLRAGS